MGFRQIEAKLSHLEIPLLKPFSTATGTVSVRGVGLVSASRNGVTGWGEAAPYPGQDEPFEDVVDAARSGTTTPTLGAAIDEAIWDLNARERGDRLSSELGPSDATVLVSMAVGMGSAAVRTVEVASESGVTRFKIKIMPGHTSHVADIRRLFPDAIIGVDANGSFDSSTISEILAMGGLDISFVEQPTPAAAGTANQMLRDTGFTVFVDESIRSVETAERALAIPEVSGVVVKPGRLGWSGSVEVVRLARAAGKLWRASGLLESGVGRSFTLALAAAADAFVSDVAPASRFFSYDIAPQTVDNGRLIVPTGPGTGLDVSTDLVRDRAVEVIPLSGSVIRGFG